MPAISREQISIAFFDLIKSAADFTAASRRFVHWDQVNETQMPFLTMLASGEQRGRQSEGLPTLTINTMCSSIFPRGWIRRMAQIDFKLID